MAAAPVDKLTPSDPRVEHHTFTPPTATVLLVHGFPDLSFAWRYQIPALLSLNLRVIAPDMLGYGRTSAPQPLADYSLKSAAADLAALAAHVVGPNAQVILGGHDWGGAVVWRLCLWHPQLVRAVFSVCTPYWPASPAWVDPATTVAKLLPHFGYQLQFAGPEVEQGVVGPARIRQFLNTLFGARGPTKEEAPFSIYKGVNWEHLDKVGESPLLSEEEMAFYVDEFSRNGMRGPLNWYRTARVNFDEERELFETGRSRIEVPALMITASRDAALKPEMSEGMDKFFGELARGQVDASHWALWEAAVEVNELIRKFVVGVLEGKKTAMEDKLAP
ncbi:Alpha/Beta hydrolase protein [Bombardia bombarda]|uniref:Alpha/Beta hydrolase protein n=1 Tax=Bombardia bombarda TaxID=252184 RepID=A0AA40CAT3_9PEZI|nr:Alpha/Beta hydrolase protein [Bombardia bombarda]